MKKEILFSAVLVLSAVVSRLISHEWNFTAMGAVAVVAGFLISHRWLALAVPLTALLISDVFLSFHNTMVSVYLGYALMTFVGIVMSTKPKLVPVVLSSLFGSFLFFVISNLGVWFEGQLYPRTLVGMTNCFEMALPFFKNEMMSTLILSPIILFAFKFSEPFFRTENNKKAVSPLK